MHKNMDYKNMLISAKNAGISTEKAMWQSVDGLNEMLCKMKEEHPEMFWKFMREQHGIMYGNHYDEAFALYDVSMIRYSDRTGKKCEGGYWTLEQIENATKGLSFPSGTTKWDKYVAFNSFYSDTCTVYNDEEIIKGAHKFYFADEDAPPGKIWLYIKDMYEGK